MAVTFHPLQCDGWRLVVGAGGWLPSGLRVVPFGILCDSLILGVVGVLVIIWLAVRGVDVLLDAAFLCVGSHNASLVVAVTYKYKLIDLAARRSPA